MTDGDRQRETQLFHFLCCIITIHTLFMYLAFSSVSDLQSNIGWFKMGGFKMVGGWGSRGHCWQEGEKNGGKKSQGFHA